MRVTIDELPSSAGLRAGGCCGGRGDHDRGAAENEQNAGQVALGQILRIGLGMSCIRWPRLARLGLAPRE
jgi:hypothetical protein